MFFLISASTAERANLLTKTHHDDLDVISDLLQEVYIVLCPLMYEKELEKHDLL